MTSLRLAIAITALLISISSLVFVIWCGRRTAQYYAEARQCWADARRASTKEETQ